MFGVSDRYVVADRADRRIEYFVLHKFMDVELAAKQPHHVTELRIVERHRFYRHEQTAQKLVVLEKDLVGLAPPGRRWKPPALGLRSLDFLRRSSAISRFRHPSQLDNTVVDAHVVAGLRRRRRPIKHAAADEAIT